MTRLKILTGTLFGAGLLPYGPGTWGSLVTLPIIYLTSWFFPIFGLYVLLTITIILSLWSTSANVNKFGDDPPQFVMDEAAGQTLTFLIVGFHYSLSQDLAILIAGFILFRFFDILKPLGIDAIQKMHGKFGVLADDLMAGVYALICLEILHRVLPGLF